VSGRRSVYDEDILDITEKYLQDYHRQELDEKTKINLVKNIYAKEELQGTRFYQELKHALRVLDFMEDYQYTRNEGQRTLRDIQSHTVMPRKIYGQIHDLLDRLAQEKDSSERSRRR